MAFLLLWLAAHLVITLSNSVGALLTAGTQKLYPSHDRNREKRRGEYLRQGLDPRKGVEGGRAHFCLAGRSMGVGKIEQR